MSNIDYIPTVLSGHFLKSYRIPAFYQVSQVILIRMKVQLRKVTMILNQITVIRPLWGK